MANDIKRAGTAVDTLKLGTSQVDKVYRGSTLAWSNTYDIEYLVAAGGGGSAANGSLIFQGGAGGGGGLLESTSEIVEVDIAYTVTVGAGGAGGVAANGIKGSNSSIIGGALSITAEGGGLGSQTGNGGGGGCGGGAEGRSSTSRTGGVGSQGGNGGDSATNRWATAGGGTAPAAGADGASLAATARTGGAGKASSISGGSVTYCRGGSVAISPAAGAVNTGNGGDGRAVNPLTVINGKSGGKGIVFIRYLGAQRGSGGTYSSSGGFSIHKFTSSGTYTA